MSDDRPVFVSEEEAARLWKRAAELQVEASRQVEERSRSLHAPPGSSGFPAGQHLPLPEVLAAAREVGIDDAFIETAVAELREERAAGDPPPPDFIERMASRFFGSPPGTLEASATVAESPVRVYAILQRLLPGEPYRLRLRSTLGGDPLDDGVLVFDSPESTSEPESYTRAVLMARDRIPRLYVTLRHVEVDGSDGCRVTVRGRVAADPEPAFWLGSLATGVASTASGGLGVAAGLGLGLAGVGLGLLGGGVALAGGALSYLGIRSRYLRPLIRSAHGLQELLEVVEAAVETDGAFLPSDPPRKSGRPEDDHSTSSSRWQDEQVPRSRP